MKNRLKTTAIFTLCLFFSLFLLVGNKALLAQEATPSPTPENEELKKLKEQNQILEEQKKKAEYEKAIAEAEKGKQSAEFPKPSATPLAGDTTIDSGVKIETEMMAYRALSNAAALVANDVNSIVNKCQNDMIGKKFFTPPNCPQKRIAILNNQWLTGLRAYWATKDQLQIMQKGYNQIYQPIIQPTVGVYKYLKDGVVAGVYKSGFSKDGKILENISAENEKAKKDNKGLFSLETKTITNATIAPTSIGNDSAAKSSGIKLSSFVNGFGAVGSVVGAAIDLMALLRTDTKITGNNYTIQESAFVSQVFRELNKDKSKMLFYPTEFSPNVNLQKYFVILADIQKVSELRAKGEQIVTGIEESEKGIKDATVSKTGLEERKLIIADELAVINQKISAIKKKYPNESKRPLDVSNSLIELEAKQKTLTAEGNAIPAKLTKIDSAISQLEKKRDELYNEIKKSLPSDQVVNGFINLGYEIDKVSYKILNRNFTFEEVEALSLNLEGVKKNLTEEAKRRWGKAFTPELERELHNPIETKRLKIFVKVGNEIISKQITLNQLEPDDFLTTAEQLKLLLPTDEEVEVEKKILEKTKTASLTKLKLLNKQFDKFFEDIVKVDEKLGLSPISLHLQSENLMDGLGCNLVTGNCDNAFALSLKVINAGGNNRTKKNLLTMAVTGDNVSHSGGAIVEYRLYDMNGAIQTSSICRAYESYRNPGSINKVKNGEPNNALCESLPITNSNGQQQH